MRAIINVSIGSWYPRGQRRLKKSLNRFGEEADYLFWTDELPPGSPSHEDTPYAFKPYAFLAARDRGYTQAVWFDSSVQLCQPLDKVWAYIAEDGYCFGDDGWFVGQWCNDAALMAMGLSREEAWKVPLMDGKIIGLDFTSDIGAAFLQGWKDYADQGVFRGSWEDHRHDITVGAVVAHRLGMKLRPEFVTRGTCADGTLVRAAGMS